MTSAAVERLDRALGSKAVGECIDQIIERVTQKLAGDPSALIAWEPVPLALYGGQLPEIIRSSWVFILRAGATTGAERHPNSHQRVTTYRGRGDLQVWANDRWYSHLLECDPALPVESRWASIPVGTWHQAVVPGEDWVVVSFHTVPEDELIEERDDPEDVEGFRQRKYV